MTAKDNLNALIECRNAFEEAATREADQQMAEYDQHLAEQARERIHEAFVDAWFTGELDEAYMARYRWVDASKDRDVDQAGSESS